jgi:hypothetical protein
MNTLRRTSLNAAGAGWTYQQTYGYDTAWRLNAIGFGDHSFTYRYLPNSNLIQTVTTDGVGHFGCLVLLFRPGPPPAPIHNF